MDAEVQESAPLLQMRLPRKVPAKNVRSGGGMECDYIQNKYVPMRKSKYLDDVAASCPFASDVVCLFGAEGEKIKNKFTEASLEGVFVSGFRRVGVCLLPQRLCVLSNGCIYSAQQASGSGYWYAPQTGELAENRNQTSHVYAVCLTRLYIIPGCDWQPYLVCVNPGQQVVPRLGPGALLVAYELCS